MTSPPSTPTRDPAATGDEVEAPEVEASPAGEASGPSTLWRSVGTYALAGAVFLVMGLIHLRLTPSNCSQRSITGLGDGTAGGVWLSWLFDTDQIGPGDAMAHVTAAPFGEPAWRSEMWSQSLLYIPWWVLTRAMGPVCAVNLAVLGSFVTSGLAMTALVRHVARNTIVAVVAGYLFAYSPFALAKASGHLAYVILAPFPLLVLFAIRSAREGRWRSVVALGVTLGLAAWIDGYYVPFAWITFGLLAVSLLVMRPPSGLSRLAQLVRLGAAAALGAVLQAPVVLLVRGGSGGRELSDPLGEMDLYGARPLDYLAADRSSGFMGWIKRSPGVLEAPLYLGTLTILLALIALALWVRTRVSARRADETTAGETEVADDTARGLPLVPALAVTALLAAYLSGPGEPELWGIRLPNPIAMVIEWVPYWRVWQRLAIAVITLTIALAAIGAAELLRRVRPTWRYGIVAVLVLVLAVDRLHAFDPPEGFDYREAPAGYLWLRDQADVDVVAEYPLRPAAVDPDSRWSTYQPVHLKQVVNAKFTVDGAPPVSSVLSGLADPNTVPLLRALGVDLLVVHPDALHLRADQRMPSTIEAEVQFFDDGALAQPPTATGRAQQSRASSDYRIDIYHLEPGPEANAYLAPWEGFHPVDVEGTTSSYWTSERQSTIAVETLGDGERCAVSFVMESFSAPRQVTVTQGRTELWSGTVDGATPVEADARCGVPLTLDTPTAPTAVRSVDKKSGDARSIGLRVRDLVAEAS